MGPKRIWRLVSSPVAIRLLSIIVGFASSVLINRSLGVDLRGGYTTITVYASLIQSIANLGITFAYVPLIKIFGEQRARSGVLTLIWGQFAFYCACLPLILILLPERGEVASICILAIAQILANQIVFIALIENIRKRNLILLLSSVLYAIANFFVFLLFPKSLFAIVACLVGKAIFEIVACGIQEHLFVVSPPLLDWAFIKETLRLGLPTAVLALLIQCNYNVDVIVLNFFNSGDYEIGLFGTAYSLSNMLWFIPDAFKELIYHDSARNRMDARTICLVLINMAICAIICIAFAFLGEWFLGLVFGDAYRAAYPTTLVVFIGIIPMVAFKLIHPIYVNEGKSGRVVALLMVSVFMNLVAAAALVPAYGAFGAALSTVFSYTICGLMFFVTYRKETGVTVTKVRQEFAAIKTALLK